MTSPGMPRKVPTPVVRCDMCGTVEPLELKGTKYGAASTEEQRLPELRAFGWLLTPTADICPHCNSLGLAPEGAKP